MVGIYSDCRTREMTELFDSSKTLCCTGGSSCTINLQCLLKVVRFNMAMNCVCRTVTVTGIITRDVNKATDVKAR